MGVHVFFSVSCPFPGSSKNRKIFVLVCTEHAKETAGWRVIRQVAENIPQSSQNQHNADDWGEADEWGDDEEVDWMAQRVEVFREQANFIPGF